MSDVSRAVQSQCRSLAPHSQAAASGDELGRVRRQPASAGQSHRLVLGGGDCRLAGRALHDTRRSAAILSSGDQDRSDPTSGVPVGAASNRGPDRTLAEDTVQVFSNPLAAPSETGR